MAANGTPVPFDGRCHVVLKVRTKDSRGATKNGVCKIPVMVGDTPYNILSTRTLGRHGWRVVLDEGVSVCHVKSGVDMIDTCIWCDTPWIRVIPHSEGDLLLPSGDSVDPAPISSIGHVAVVSQKTKEDLEIHRAKGHMPFHPDCEHCLKSRGVTQHRRKSERGVETEIVADFMFLDSSGEMISVAERQTSSSFKVLVLREAFSSSIGAVMITENIAKDRGLLLKWLAEFGMSSSQASIVLLTDSEEAVKSFVAGASDKYIFMVRKAAPQAHEQLGGAERTVRVLKEGLATLQSDFQSLGCVWSFRRDLLQLALSYLCMSVNANGKAFGGERSPKEVAVGRRLPDTPFALFGSKVLAEVPESVKALCPNMSRFEAAAFLHPQFGSLGSLVYAHVRVGQVLTPKVFVAKSIKLVFPIELVFESGMFEVLRRRGELGPERPDHPVAPRILPSSQGASLKCPVSGPPKEFFERYGFSGECRACSNMAQFGSRKGSSHGRACCLRYEAWLRSQVATDDSMDVEVPVASDAEAMREALSELAEDESRQDRAVEEAQGSPLPPPASGDAASSEAPARIVSEAAPSGRVFTRGCPACESGMNAPGIRHNADCKRRNQNLSVRFSVSGEPDDDEASSRRLPENLEGAAAPESEGIGALDEDTEMPFADPVLTGSEGGGSLEAEEVLRGSSAVKRSSEVPLEDLEREIRQDQERVASLMVTFHNCETGNDVHMPLASFVEQAFQVSNYVPLLSGLVDSVQFAPNSTSVVLPFGKRSHLRLWKPSSAVDDSTLGELSGDQVMEGMVKEVNNLSHMETGDLLTASELQSLEKRFLGTLKVIPSRWVTTQKTPTTVRARIVIKDIAGKNSESARALGISSPTPSADALFTVLGVAGCRDCVIASADVSHAFMATPLRERDVVMRFPLSVSSVSGDPLYLHLNKALNGLRKASQEWIYFVGETVKVLGLQSCSLEPCLFSGMLESGPCLLLVYVDDFLCIAPTKEDVDHIFGVIEEKVELKRTGLINSSKDGGGTLRFIGRVISRRKGESSITVSLPEDYLDETFKAYGLSGKGSSSPPDVAVHVEKLDGVPLSPEAYARFRSALGKVAWMTQTRQDLRAYVSILATQQATPTNHTEHGLRALLRFLKNDMCVVVRLPAASDVLAPSQHYQGKRHLVCFSDASHAPLRCTKRRGISGGVLTLDGCVIKTLCRHQQLVSLSSMESELFALQSVAQEMSSLGKFMARVFMSFRESEEVELPGVLYSDSESALKLLRNLDTPRQSRHLEIRVEWLKARVAAGSLVLAFKKGIENPSDLLTKCLGSSAFGIHREALGFESLSGPLASLCNHEKRLVMVEVCCRPQSSVQGACRRVGMSYVGVTENMQSDSVFKEVRRYLLNFACDCVFVHVSTPCSSGSYLRRFSGGSSSKSDWEWFEVFPCVLKYLKLGKHSSFELPWNNEIWQHDLCQKVLKKAGHTFDVPVRTRAAMVLTTDERRELRRLLDKMDSADGLASTANTSMTDGTKRLRDVGGYPEDGSTASGSACGAQLPISKGSAKGVVSTPKCYEDLVDAFEGEEFGESDNVIVVSYAGTEVTSVPLPSDLSVEDWGRTICDLPKVQKNKTWFKKSYAALVKLSKEDSDLASYLNWVKEKFGRSYDPTTPSSQASDLAGYLMRQVTFNDEAEVGDFFPDDTPTPRPTKAQDDRSKRNTRILKSLRKVWADLPDEARTQLSDAGFEAPQTSDVDMEPDLLALLQNNVERLPECIRQALPPPPPEPTPDPLKEGRESGNALRRSILKLKQLGQEKLRLQEEINKTKTKLHDLLRGMQELQEAISEATDVARKCSDTYERGVLLHALTEDQKANLNALRDGQANGDLTEEAQDGSAENPGARQVGLTTPTKTRSRSPSRVPSASDAAKVPSRIPPPLGLAVLEPEVSGRSFSIPPSGQLPVAQLLPSEGFHALLDGSPGFFLLSPWWPPSLLTGPVYFPQAFASDPDPASTWCPNLAQPSGPSSRRGARRDRRSKHRRHRLHMPGLFTQLQVEMCDQALNPGSSVERDLVEFASKVEDAISPGSSEEWFLERALDAIHDDTPSPAKWHLLKQMAQVLSMQHNTPHSPASFRLLSANVTHWRPEVRDWAFSSEGHGVLLQELHLTTEAAHEAAIAASKRGFRLFSSPPFLSDKRRPLGGFGVLIRSFLNPRHVLTHTVEGCGFLAVSLRCSGFELTLVSIYLQSGTGFNSPVNADVLARLLAFLPSLRGVWIVAGDWNNPIQDLLATRLEEVSHGRFLGSGSPTAATDREIDFFLVSSPAVNLLGLTSTDKLTLDFAELSSFLEVSHGFPDRGRGAFVPLLHKPLVQGHSVTFAWKGQLPSLVSAVLHLLDRPEAVQPFLWSTSDTSLPSEVRAFCDRVRDGSASSATLRAEGTALLGQLRREQTAQQADQYGEWLEAASGSHLGPLFRAIKSHEQVLDRPFQDCDGLRRVFERHEHWARVWHASVFPQHFSHPLLAELRSRAVSHAGTLAPLTVPNLQKLLKKAGKKKGGPDGWSYPALRALDPAALQLVADFLARAEAEVLLPFQLTCVQVALLPKSADKVEGRRGAWTSAYAPAHPWDRAVPGQASLDTALARLVRSEHSKLEKTHIVSLFLDLRGFFDSVSYERLLLQGLAHSFPPLHLWFALQVYQGPRCLVADSIAATPLFPGRGVPQGCPLAPSLSKLTMSEPLQKVSSLPSVTNTDLWLDDVSLDVVGSDPVEVASAALQAYRVLHASLGLEGLEVETTKTKFVAGTVRARAALQQLRRPGEPDTADLVKDLGLDCAAGRRRRITTAQKRFRTGIGRVRHMRRLRIRRRWVRGRLLQASALKAGLYGHQAVGVAPKRLKVLRSAVAREAGRFEHGSADVILDLMSHRAVDPHQLVVVEQLQALGRLASSASPETLRLLTRTWASSWSRQASATHGWKIVNGPVSALIQYLLDLRVSAPTPEVWTHREATFHFRFREPGAVFEASAFLRQVIQLERWSRIGAVSTAAGAALGIDWTVPRRLLASSRTKPWRHGLRAVFQGALLHSGNGGKERCKFCGAPNTLHHVRKSRAEVRRTGLFLEGTPDLTGLFVATDASGGPATKDSESEAIAQALLSSRGTFDLTCDCQPALRSLQGPFTKRTSLVWSKAWDQRHRAEPHWVRSHLNSSDFCLEFGADALWRRELNSLADKLAKDRAEEVQTPHRLAAQKEVDRVTSLVCEYLGRRAAAILAKAEKEDFVPRKNRLLSALESSASPSPNKRQRLQALLDVDTPDTFERLISFPGRPGSAANATVFPPASAAAPVVPPAPALKASRPALPVEPFPRLRLRAPLRQPDVGPASSALAKAPLPGPPEQGTPASKATGSSETPGVKPSPPAEVAASPSVGHEPQATARPFSGPPGTSSRKGEPPFSTPRGPGKGATIVNAASAVAASTAVSTAGSGPLETLASLAEVPGLSTSPPDPAEPGLEGLASVAEQRKPSPSFPNPSGVSGDEATDSPSPSPRRPARGPAPAEAREEPAHVQVFSENFLRCFACGVTTSNQQLMEAHAMTARHVRLTTAYVAKRRRELAAAKAAQPPVS
ncbi:unnamed protein product [Symbiodinium sp. CCMP2592]|nr:unnamed protein product [Symbiodinium sp. CCMP2592]